MLLPKEPMRLEKLSCTMRDFQEMMGEFKLEGFSGYALLDFRSVQYAVLFEQGTLVRVVNLSKRKAACHTMERLRRHLEDSPAFVRVVELPWFSVDQMVRILMHERIFENLLTDFVNFQRLLETLEKKRSTGIMELQIGDRVHFLILRFGIPQFCVLQYDSALKTEPVEDLVTIVGKKGALINFYVPKEISFEKAFETLGNGLLEKYAELSGTRLANHMEKEMNAFLEQFDYVAIVDGCYHVSHVSDDFRDQEQLFKRILHHQVELFIASMGRRTTYRIYNHLLRSVQKEVRGILREVIL